LPGQVSALGAEVQERRVVDVDIILFGVPALGLIIGIVQALKAAGMADWLAPWVALILSFVASVIALVIQIYPDASPYLSALVGAVVLWLSVTGAYERGKAILDK
jgi:hypothetical protein